MEKCKHTIEWAGSDVSFADVHLDGTPISFCPLCGEALSEESKKPDVRRQWTIEQIHPILGLMEVGKYVQAHLALSRLFHSIRGGQDAA